MEKKVRYAILAKGFRMEKWQADALQQLLKIEGASPEIVIFRQEKPQTSSNRVFKFMRGNKQLWKAFLHLKKKKLVSAQPTDMKDLMGSLPILTLDQPELQGNGFAVREHQVQLIQNLQLDFILCLDNKRPVGNILDAAKFGVWAFQHGDGDLYRGGPAAFWEIYNNQSITATSLVKLTEKKDEVIVLKKGFLKTKYNYARNRNQMMTEACRWPAMVCRDVVREQVELFEKVPVAQKGQFYTSPDNFQFISYLFLVNAFHLKKILHNCFYVDFWNVGLAKGHISEFLKDDKPAVEWFPVESNRVFLADPFAWPDPQKNAKLHMFFETFSFQKGKGYIEYACYDSGFGKPVMVIEENTHMSYPYLVNENNEILISTENAENASVQVYRPTNFPLQWERSNVIFNQFAAIDSSIFQWQGTYWMFNSDRKDGMHHNLNLFYADQFAGPWTPHPQNPVKTDIRSARCAGTPFIHEGSLFRPSMDYSEKIQGRVVLNKITVLSKSLFEEVSVKTINPYQDSMFPDKIHTLSAAGDYTLIDGAREAFIFSDPIFLKYKLNSMFSKLKVVQRLKSISKRTIKMAKVEHIFPPIQPGSLAQS